MCDVNVSTRDVELDAEQRGRIKDRAREAAKVFDVRGTVCDIMVDKSNSRSKSDEFSCSVSFSLPRRSLHAKGSGRDPEAAVADALSKSERQLRRHKTQVCDKWKRMVDEDDDVFDDESPEAVETYADIEQRYAKEVAV